jgi:hypothetical protein
MDRKQNGKLSFVDIILIKVHQAGQGTIGGFQNQAIGPTKGGHNLKLTATVDDAGHLVAFLLFPDRFAWTTEAKPLLPFLAKNIVVVGGKSFDSDELRVLIKHNSGLACIPPRSNRTRYRWWVGSST